MTQLIGTAQDLLRQVYGIEPTPGEHIQTTLNRELFLGNDTGAWATLQPDGITLGAIVEGSDAEIGPYRLVFPFSARQFLDFLRLIEAEAGDVLRDGPRCRGVAEDLGPTICPFRPGGVSSPGSTGGPRSADRRGRAEGGGATPGRVAGNRPPRRTRRGQSHGGGGGQLPGF